MSRSRCLRRNRRLKNDIVIGLRNDKLEKKAMEIAKKIGKVIVDHGDTNCKTPDAVEYIARTKAYRNKKKAKAAAK